ncbi:MAG: methylamine utilization protein [Burkholderiales bacterium]|nr:methylamine utilization protein [Burkholderiales bacterium]
MSNLPASNTPRKTTHKHLLTAVVATLISATSLSAHAGSLLGLITDKNGNPVADGVLYAIPLDTPPPAAKAAETLSISQENYLFLPYVTVIRSGSSVRFFNRDPHDHHIKSFSPAKAIDLRVNSKKEDVPQVLFDKTGEVALVCYFHDWMRGFISVVDTPYFAKTDKTGNALLNSLPPGKYEVKAWVPKMIGEPLSQTVQLAATDAVSSKFQLSFVPVAPPKPVTPKKKSESTY